MANANPHAGGSQFFINFVDNNCLDIKRPVSGRIVEGMDIGERIGKVPTGSNNRPPRNATIIQAERV